MLSLLGESIEEHEIEVDSIFLMDVLEKNEDIESTTDLGELEILEEQNNKEIKYLVGEIKMAFSKNDMASAKLLLTKLQYICNIESKIKEKKLEMST